MHLGVHQSIEAFPLLGMHVHRLCLYLDLWSLLMGYKHLHVEAEIYLLQASANA